MATLCPSCGYAIDVSVIIEDLDIGAYPPPVPVRCNGCQRSVEIIGLREI